MPSLRLPPFMLRLNGITSLLTDRGELAVRDDAKTVVVTNESSLVYGATAAAVDVVASFEYTSTNSEDFVVGAMVKYAGDAGAFTILADENGTFGAAIALTAGTLVWIPVPPSTYGNPYALTIRALAANSGVAKAGTLTVYDRFNFADSAAPSRTMKVLTLSKTYTAP